MSLHGSSRHLLIDRDKHHQKLTIQEDSDTFRRLGEERQKEGIHNLFTRKDETEKQSNAKTKAEV
jgi:hypothetical protein